jgi:hypothetical protein
VTKSHVKLQFTVYHVNQGARLTAYIVSDMRGLGRKRKKVVVLRELHRAIIFTNKMSKQVTQSHVKCSSQCTMLTEVSG